MDDLHHRRTDPDAGIPEGFVPVNLGPGYSAAFGPVYRHGRESKLAFRVARHHLNPVEACHGGAMACFADMLVAAVHTGAGSRAAHPPTITITVDFIAPATLGSWVEGAATLVKSTRNMLFVQALITADGEIVARANGIYRHYDGAAPKIRAKGLEA